MYRESPVTILLKEWATIWLCPRNMASISRLSSLIPFPKLVRVDGRSSLESWLMSWSHRLSEQPREGDQPESGMEFRAHAALEPCTEALDHVISGLVSLLDLPASVIDVRERQNGVAFREQRGCTAIPGVGMFVRDQADAQAPSAQFGPAWRLEGDDAVPLP